jgi:TM2 domain-containing membrane protein YozV
MPIPSSAKLCPFSCEAIKIEAKKCRYWGETLDPVLRAAQEAYRTAGQRTARPDNPSKITACLFAIFLGPFGAHKFYLGHTGWGIFYLLSTILLCWTVFIPLVIALLSFIEGIIYITYSDSDFVRIYGR